jgi:ADP-heptose:LPS heptosyltransferase
VRTDPRGLLRGSRANANGALSLGMLGSAILVIKLGALGDFIHALGPMRAIRDHHAEAKITLLTRPSYQELAHRSDLFDAIQSDQEPKIWNIAGLFRLRQSLRSAQYARVYDLQTSDRTGFYYRLLSPGVRPEWSGIVPGCSHYHHYTRPTLIHTIDRQIEQLRIAGILNVPRPDLSFMNGDIGRFDLPDRFVLLVPGSSARMAIKRWPAAAYGELAVRLARRGLTPVVLGGAEEADAISTVLALCPEAISLQGQTTILDIPALGRQAVGCAGNDTGPMHMAALAGCPTVAIFSTASFPDKAAPRGPTVSLLVRERLSDLPVDAVEAALLNPPTDGAA